MLRFLLLFPFLLASSLYGQSLFDRLVADGDTVRLTLDTEWRKMVRNKAKKAYQVLRLTVDTQEKQFTFPGKIRTRGNVRLQVCDNPSLKIKLNKDSLVAAGFSSVNDLKLVLQCSNSELGLSYLRREQLAYQLYEVYSEHYHRTVPVVLTIAGAPDVHAFLVEEEEQLSARYGQVVEPERASTRGMNRRAYVNLCLFNFLILNTDWQIFNRHNVELVADSISGRLIPIPYDFDYSGFVSTSYAIPLEVLNIASVHVPKWKGRNVTEEELLRGAAHFLARADTVRTMIEKYPNLRPYARKRLLRRLAAFHEILADEEQLLKLLE